MTRDEGPVDVLVLTEGTWRVLERWDHMRICNAGSAATVLLPTEVDQETPVLVGWRQSPNKPPERYRFARVVLSRQINRQSHESLLAWLPMPKGLADQPWHDLLRKPA